jgi:hypothetical protein
MIITYYPHSKCTHNLKVIEFEFFQKPNVYFKSSKFQESFIAHVNVVQCTWHIKQSCNLWYKKLEIKIVNIFLVWFEIMIKFKNKTKNIITFAHFEKFVLI